MTITACPETDLAVATACGIVDIHRFAMTDVVLIIKPEGSKAFRPSTDLNDAFLAAEKLATTIYCLYDDATCDWICGLDFGRCTPDDCRFRGRDQSLPIAICVAILRMAEKP